jgi:hypothetical protein
MRRAPRVGVVKRPGPRRKSTSRRSSPFNLDFEELRQAVEERFRSAAESKSDAAALVQVIVNCQQLNRPIPAWVPKVAAQDTHNGLFIIEQVCQRRVVHHATCITRRRNGSTLWRVNTFSKWASNGCV